MLLPIADAEAQADQGLCAGNLKMTMPIAVATTQVAWGYSLSPNGYRSGNSSVLVADMLQWAGNYLTLCQNGTSYAVQVSWSTVQQQHLILAHL